MKHLIFLLIALPFPCWSQVLDVNGDGEVGPEEALAVAEEWKGTALRPNEHNHLGQTWVGNRNPLTIRGSFPIAIIPGPLKNGEKGSNTPPAAPLILDNEATNEGGNPLEPDLILAGRAGILAVPGEGDDDGSLYVRSNLNIFFHLGYNNDPGFVPAFIVENPNSIFSAARITQEGNMSLSGVLTAQNVTEKIDHPLDPANKYLVHSSVNSPETKNVYDGVIALDENGESRVDLPSYFEAFNSDFRYTLTPIGTPAPNLHVAEEIQNNQFKIGGGAPGMKVSWQVTGIRKNSYAKSHPIEVEPEKPEEVRGKYLHLDPNGEPIN